MASDQCQACDGSSKNLPMDNQSIDANLACSGSIISDTMSDQSKEQKGSNQKQFSYPVQKILNEAYLIANRKINFNSKARRDFKLMCEEKSSRNKLEEVHCSLPSSLKSTFIMTFSPDGQKVASTHGDHRIYLCDLSTGKLLDTLEGHPKTPWCLAWHPSNREILASGCLAGEVRVWDLRTKACESWTSENNSIITSLDFHPKERILVIATANDIHFWDWSDSKPFAKTTTCHDKEKVRFVVFDSSGTKLITGISNLPKFANYNSDSLQNRIIDSYLTQDTIDPLPTENMTQSSETAGPISGHLDTNENYNESSHTQSSALPRPSNIATQFSEHDSITYRVTVTLTRVAALYRQLESLEDSMRHTSFPPYVNPRQISTTNEANDCDSNTVQLEQDNKQAQTTTRGPSKLSDKPSRSTTEESSQAKERPPKRAAGDQGEGPSSQDAQTDDRSTPALNSYEPFVVSFDESLEQLQLEPLIVDGHTINLASVVERYPINLSNQLHYLTQIESINQVNQNYIRISKLISSARLYRQIVQQIISNSSGQGHYQPNQILTAQCASPRSSRHVSNLPIVLRSFPSVANPLGIANAMETVASNRNSRSSDPILAIQFRNSARNVPLVTICKMGLLSARAVCIMRSQQLIEQAAAELRSSIDGHQERGTELENPMNASEQYSGSDGQNVVSRSQTFLQPSFFPSLNQLHQSLTMINLTPLTTSNVHNHILTLRGQINRLLNDLTSILHSPDEARRLIALIQNIAHSLTRRSWNIPLGANLDDIRLDVIHMLCVIDLTLHLTRQVQLLQIQRLSALARIEESKRVTVGLTHNQNEASNSRNDIAPASSYPVEAGQSAPVSGPGTSCDSAPSSDKRKDSDASSACSGERKKRMKISSSPMSSNNSPRSEVRTIDSTLTSPTQNRNQSMGRANDDISNNREQTGSSSNVAQMTNTDSPPNDRIFVWDSPSPYEHNPPRYMFAAASSVIDNHFLVRIHHRILGNSTTLEQTSPDRHSGPHESRRRALSQDDLVTQGSSDGSTVGGDVGRTVRVIAGNYSSSSVNPAGVTVNAWQRYPILQVYQTSRGPGSHIWFNHLTFPFLPNSYNYRLQCWDFSMSALPNIKDCQSNIVTDKCRIHNDSSIDISSDGGLIACLVPRDVGAHVPNLDMKIFSLRSQDFGVCYYQLSHGPNAISVSFSPSSNFIVVGLSCSKYISVYDRDDDLTIAKVFRLNEDHTHELIRDIKIKRDSSMNLNAIRWMSRGIVYNVGPQHGHRYLPMRGRVI